MFRIEDKKLIITTERGEIQTDLSPRQVISGLQLYISEIERTDRNIVGEKIYPLGEEYPSEYIRRTGS